MAFLLFLASCQREQVVVLYVAAETRGTIAPCGCNTDPLGGLARFAALVTREAGAKALVHAGLLERDPEEAAPRKKIEVDAKAELITETFKVLESLTEASPGVHRVGPLRLGIEVLTAETPPGKPDRPQNVDFAILLIKLPPSQGRARLRELSGFDVAVQGMAVGEGEPTPLEVGTTRLLIPGERLQKVYRLELHLRKGGSRFAYAGGPGELERTERDIDRMKKQLAKFNGDKEADPGFIAAKRKELADLETRKAELARRNGIVPPEKQSWFSAELIALRHSLPEDPEVAMQMQEVIKKVDHANQQADCDRPQTTPLPASSKKASYVGAETCGRVACHEKAFALWKSSAHSRAWGTLVTDGRAHFYECIGCHVTGFGEPERRGATICAPDNMASVQCEACHGPGSRHVAAEGLEEVSTVVRRPPDDFCATKCHTPEHSDTFELTAYLRDILGPGHGAKRRAALGPGVTGHELRQNGLRKAGRVH